MASKTEEVCDNGGGSPPPSMSAVDDQQPPLALVEVAEDKNKSPRHPRWTRQETLTLIEGKKVAENRGRRGRKSSSVFGSGQVEPKWDSVASYCKQNAVNRGPVQCRKRWSNMVGDFKKIKAWELKAEHVSESYWLMRNDVRKENKLPGFFDREVFDVLDGKAVTKSAYKLALVTVSAAGGNDENGVAGEEDVEEEEGVNAEGEADVVFDSGRRAASEDGLFQDSDKAEAEEDGGGSEERDRGNDTSAKKIHDPVPISEQRYQPSVQDDTQGISKRRRVSTDECQDKNFDARLIDVLNKNTSVLNARLESENTNAQLDRDLRKDFNESLVSALNRISDALTKIADKL